jgi:outer membrane protein assembly factor BamB
MSQTKVFDSVIDPMVGWRTTRRLRRGVGLATAFVVVALLVSPAVAASAATVPGPDTAVTYQISVGHDGYSGDTTIVPPLSALWSHSFASDVSYPLIADGMVFVTATGDAGSPDASLFALDEATGAIVWSQPISGTYGGFSSTAYDGGLVFDLNYDGLLRAFDAATGALEWSSQLAGQGVFTSPPTADSGVVYAAGAGVGGTVYAVSESTGSVLWTQQVFSNSSPALSDTDVYVYGACGPVYALDQATGQPQWTTAGSGPCGADATPVYSSGLVYAFNYGGVGESEILDASTGALVGTFQASLPPAFDGDIGLFFNYGTLQAVNGGTLWTFTGDGGLDTAPIAVGNTVYEGSSSGMLYGLDVTTGQVVWSADVGSGVTGGLGAGQGLLVVPAGEQLTAYAAATSAAVVTSTSLAASPATATPGEPVVLTATESASDGSSPTGTIQFEVGGTDIGSPVAVDANGVATTTTWFPAGGTEALSAVFTPGSPSYSGSTGTLSLTVDAGPYTAGSTPVVVSVPPAGAFTLTIPATTAILTPNSAGTQATGNLGTVTVTDTRNSYPGWAVYGEETTDFIGSGLPSGTTVTSIPSDDLGWTPAGTVEGGAALGPPEADIGEEVYPGVLAQAHAGTGFGTDTLDATLTLTIPPGTPAGTYTGGITMTYLEALP